ncbi:MAG: hypothetical protein EOO88_23060 [Pedobacter sp.]|nr:MAG: hypothetical protein EOO88_23060 [Pedobacter sp.]
MKIQEKKIQLDRLLKLINSAIDYRIKLASSGEMSDAMSEVMVPGYEDIRSASYLLHQKSQLSKLKYWWKCLQEEPRETRDRGFQTFITSQTGIAVDIFDAFEKKIERIIHSGRVKSDDEYREVVEKLDALIQDESGDADLICILNGLVTSFEKKIPGI